MCVCMDAEAIIDKGVLSGKERIIVYTRKRKQKLVVSATDGPSNSANGESKISFFKDDNATHKARVDKLGGQDAQDRIFSEKKPLVVVSKGECSKIDISKEENEGEEVVVDGLAEEGLSSCVKEVEDRSQISCGNEDGLQIHASCDPVPNSDQEAEPQLDISSMEEPSAGEVVKDGPLELQPNGEEEPMLDCRGESSGLDISKEHNEGGVEEAVVEGLPLGLKSGVKEVEDRTSKEHNEGGGEEAVVEGLPLGLKSGVKEVEDRTPISCGNEDELHIHASSEPDRCGNPVLNSEQEAEPQLDMSSIQEPSAGKLLRDSPLELHPNSEREPMDCPLSDDDQEMNSNHANEASSDQALESSRRVEFQPSSCEVFAPNSTEDPRQLPDNRWEPPPSGGKVKLPSGATGPDSNGLDRPENHQDLVIPEAVVSKPLISMNEDKVYIALNESSSKDDLLSLKRKLEFELDQVRRVARKVDEKELQVADYNERNMTNPAVVSGSDASDFSVYNQPHLMIGHSSMDSVGHPVMENSHEFVENGTRTPNIFAQSHSTMRSHGHLDTRPYRQFNGSLTVNNHEDGEFVDRDKRTPKANPYYMNSDFYLENDRLPPENHNKMPKANGVSKKRRLGGEYGVSFGFGGDKDGNKLLKDCSNLLQRLMKHKNGWVFNNPVDPIVLGIPDYLDIIKHPMDLGTIKTRLAKKQYASAIEFTEDVRLVFSNAMTYNPKGHEVHTWAEELLKIFEDRWVSIENGYRRKKQHSKPGYFPARRHDYSPAPFLPLVTAPPALSPAFGPAQITPPVTIIPDSITVPVNHMVTPANYNIPRVRRTPALPKPKANEPNKRNMTYEEKQRLSTNLQSLPLERLDAVVQLMKKRSIALSQTDEEIEVDIDGVDVETLWELDRYVTNFKKSYSKYRRRAEKLAQQAQEEAAAAAAAAAAQAQNTNQLPAALVSQNECITGDGNTNNAPIEVETHANGNASSSSDSDSSDSGSSSSDSDSDSSSGDELDVGHSPGA